MADIAGIILGPLVKDINSLIQREVGSVWGVKADLRKLSSSLTTIQAVLADAEVQQIKKQAVRDWLMKLKNAAYDAQNILEDWAVAVADHEARRQSNAANRTIPVRQSFLSLLNLKRLLFRYKIAGRVKEIRERFHQIAKDKSDFHLKVVDVAVRVEGAHHTIDSTRVTGPLSKEPQIYGRDGDRDKIVKMLLENRNMGQGIAVCPIFGIGGLGKTTLAQLVFNDDRVQKHFDKRIWVCVSDDFNEKRLLKEIVHVATGSRLDHDNLGEVLNSVMEAVMGKKFLLVLDDVWSENPDDFNTLKNPLSSGAEGSSIVVTTRSEKVAIITKAILEPYKLGDLSEHHCWSLFRSCAFDGKEKPYLETIGRDIFKKCGGLPLAAKALGSLLRFKDEEEQWKQVRDSEIWELEEDKILPALRLSYYNLSPRERQCFAYCSFFPKNYKMRKEEIIHLWWANGLLQKKMMGEHVFNQLKFHSFFQNMRKDVKKNKMTFKIHDLLHDLASSVMKMEHLRIVVEAGRNTTPDIQVDEIRPRHMSITMSPSSPSSLGEVSYLPSFISSHQYRYLRTLFLFSNHNERLSLSSHDVSIIFGLKYLRALRIDKWSCILSKKLPPSFGKNLKHLRMLSLKACELSSLQAESFCGMRNLQFLDLSYNDSLIALPHAMGKNLEKLRHLNLCRCGLSLLQAESFCGMRSLQYLDLSENDIKALPHSIGDLEKLRHLNLSWNSYLKTLPESLGNLTKLETLKLNNCYELTLLPQNISCATSSTWRMRIASV